MSDGPGHFGLTLRYRECLAELRNGVLVLRLLFVDPPEIEACLREVGIQLEGLSSLFDSAIVLARVEQLSRDERVHDKRERLQFERLLILSQGLVKATFDEEVTGKPLVSRGAL